MNPKPALANLFREMALATEYLGEDRFIARAYRTASEIIKNFPGDLREFFDREGKQGLLSIKGIGPAIAAKITEYLETGEIKRHTELMSLVPAGAMALMGVKGIGPATARKLYDEMGVRGPEELAAALRQGKLGKVPGFGNARIRALKRALGVE